VNYREWRLRGPTDARGETRTRGNLEGLLTCHRRPHRRAATDYRGGAGTTAGNGRTRTHRSNNTYHGGAWRFKRTPQGASPRFHVRSYTGPVKEGGRTCEIISVAPAIPPDRPHRARRRAACRPVGGSPVLLRRIPRVDVRRQAHGTRPVAPVGCRVGGLDAVCLAYRRGRGTRADRADIPPPQASERVGGCANPRGDDSRRGRCRRDDVDVACRRRLRLVWPNPAGGAGAP